MRGLDLVVIAHDKQNLIPSDLRCVGALGLQQTVQCAVTSL